MKKLVIGIVVLVIAVVSFLSFGNGAANGGITENAGYEILKKWELPDELSEISGISWIGEDRIACVQDEDGIIFIYNLKTSKVENTINFGSGGDYEGITVIGDNAYVLRSDGVVFEISNFESAGREVTKHETDLFQIKGMNLEGLAADPENNRLLLAVKQIKGVTDSKEIFAFDLDRKNTGKEPIFRVELADPIFKGVQGKLKSKFSPGEIAIHPQTKEIYILDGTNPKILIADKNGTLKDLLILQSRDFVNPEGLTFSPRGEMYISNEADSGGAANILRVSLNK